MAAAAAYKAKALGHEEGLVDRHQPVCDRVARGWGIVGPTGRCAAGE